MISIGDRESYEWLSVLKIAVCAVFAVTFCEEGTWGFWSAMLTIIVWG